MTVEQVELRKILTQMLADNGINRETIKDFVGEIVSERWIGPFKELFMKPIWIRLWIKPLKKRLTKPCVMKWVGRFVGQWGVFQFPSNVLVIGVEQMARDEFWDALKEHAHRNHQERVSKNPDRIAYAIQQFEAHGIEYQLKNPQTGHFHCWRKSDDQLFQFYAGTGKIQGVQTRGIHNLIKLLEG